MRTLRANVESAFAKLDPKKLGPALMPPFVTDSLKPTRLKMSYYASGI